MITVFIDVPPSSRASRDFIDYVPRPRVDAAKQHRHSFGGQAAGSAMVTGATIRSLAERRTRNGSRGLLHRVDGYRRNRRRSFAGNQIRLCRRGGVEASGESSVGAPVLRTSHMRTIRTFLGVTLVFAAAALTTPNAVAQLPEKTAHVSTKLSVIALESMVGASTQTVTAQTNPKEMAIDKAVAWTRHVDSRSDYPHLEISRLDGRKLAFELSFDGSATQTDVRAAYASAPEDEKRPPRVKVVWQGLNFEGVIESVNVKYTLFSDSGVPLRATCSLKVLEASRASFRR
jgi:hypothetical protein